MFVVQCKHFAGSPFRTLLANIRDQEQQRIASFPAKTRYILTTSVGLTPRNKDQLREVIGSPCKSPAEIFGKDDLNNLLARHPRVEERHYKLWLTSTAMLKGIIHAGIVTDSVYHLDEVRRRLSRYVPNASLDRAKTILDQHHFCIISGIPGVGKTTLAEVLVAHLVDKENFAPFRISARLEEIRSIKDRSRRQVFYFDDFLGRTDLVHLDRNEDRNLVELMREVRRNDRWRLILTTREYVLKSAKTRYEAIHQFRDDFAQCIVDVADYTRPVRAQILYNHIYFSDLPKSHKLALLERPNLQLERDDDRFSYRDIIDHPSYLPRLIEFMTAAYTGHGNAKEYIADFRTNLDDPRRIWEHAFRRQISEASQRLVLVLATLPRRVHEDDARACFLQFSRHRRKEYGTVTRADDWDEALRELDGSFLASSRAGRSIALQFHNPSVEDFIKKHLRRSPSDADDLLASAIFFDQYASLWARCGKRFASHDTVFFERVKRFVPGRAARVVSTREGIIGSASGEEQVSLLMRVAKKTGRDMSESAMAAIERLAELWRRGEGSRRSVLDLLLYWRQKVGDIPREPFLAARELMLEVEEGDIDGFEICAAFVEAFPEGSSEDMRACLAERFEAVWWDFEDLQSEDELVSVVEAMEHIGGVLGVDVGRVLEDLNERIEELVRNAEEEAEYQSSTTWERDDEVDEEKEIDRMFAALRSLLAGS